jgi:probable rRNA maturation factor
MNLTLTNLHPSLRPPLNKWRQVIGRMVDLFRNETDLGDLFLKDLSVVWMADVQIAEANQHFLNHRGPTDILTFDYGQGIAEILISLDTASKEAKAHRQTLEQELRLYLVHGLLHLAGFKDKTSVERHQMRQQERKLLRRLQS